MRMLVQMPRTPKKRKVKGGRNVSSDGHLRVPMLPRSPQFGSSYWIESPNGRHSFTHLLFRFPAKFHPPIVRWALDKYGRRGSLVLDPFAGSGTLQVEALSKGISAIGIDIDPVSCLVSKAKTTPINPRRLKESFDQLKELLDHNELFYDGVKSRPGGDIDDKKYDATKRDLWIPNIPNIFHWFRKYVIIDLAILFNTIENLRLPKSQRTFFRACAISIIRRSSNADPGPVSGLEVTRIQAERNKTRRINVNKLFYHKCEETIVGMSQLWLAVESFRPRPKARSFEGNALGVAQLLDKHVITRNGVPLIITSPPYCRAVEYSRRHQLEMYWLKKVSSQEQYVDITHRYIGRNLVRQRDWDETVTFGISGLDTMLNKISAINPRKSRTIRHYFVSMEKAFIELHNIISKRGIFICIIGDSVCCNIPIHTADFIAELALPHYTLVNRFSYAVRNHSMQYGLWNGDGIKEETILVFRAKHARSS